MLDQHIAPTPPSELSPEPTLEPVQESAPESVNESSSRPKKPEAATAGKRSCSVTCSSVFRDAVNNLARQRGVSVANLACSVILLLPEATIHAFPDPGEPVHGDQETVVLKTSLSSGQSWKRKPHLQVAVADDYGPEFVRRALGIALAMAEGHARVSRNATGIAAEGLANATDVTDATILTQQDKISQLRNIISTLSFESLPNGINSPDEALYVLGFAPGRFPDMDAIKARYRERATIHHPDNDQGDTANSHIRMSQLNQAMEVLRRWVM